MREGGHNLGGETCIPRYAEAMAGNHRISRPSAAATVVPGDGETEAKAGSVARRELTRASGKGGPTSGDAGVR